MFVGFFIYNYYIKGKLGQQLYSYVFGSLLFGSLPQVTTFAVLRSLVAGNTSSDTTTASFSSRNTPIPSFFVNAFVCHSNSSIEWVWKDARVRMMESKQLQTK
jgi:hypothetical protein